MTDAQDLILDKLVGSTVGVNWPDGPLALAASVLGDVPIPLGRPNDRRGKAEIARRLGYPMLLCEAIQGGVRGLTEEEDRRSFAMLVFRSVVIPGRPTVMTARAQNLLAGAVAVGVHPIFCRPDCPALVAFQSWMNGVGDPKWRGPSVTYTVCARANRPVWHGSLNNSPGTPETRLLVTLEQVHTGIILGKSVNGWASVRESARLVASERGVGEAARLCVDVARRCGMAAEAV